MQNWKDTAEKQGFELFNDGTGREASEKGFSAVTQDSVDYLTGLWTVSVEHTRNINEGVQILKNNSAGILKHLAGIENNTGNTNVRLQTIENNMSDVKNEVSAVRNGIDEINLHGITLKK